MNLNEYHRQFLIHLNRYNVQYLVIGGQAKSIFDSSYQTSDLDIWIDVEDGNNSRCAVAGLRGWKEKYPSHFVIGQGSAVIPDTLKPNLQISIPLIDTAEVNVGHGIDILTSIKDKKFEDYLANSMLHQVSDEL